VGRRKKVTTASLMEGETADTEKKTAKRKTAKKKRAKKTGSRKKSAGNAVKKVEE